MLSKRDYSSAALAYKLGEFGELSTAFYFYRFIAVAAGRCVALGACGTTFYYAPCAAKPNEAVAWLGLGESLHALQSDHSAALEACQTAAQLSPLSCTEQIAQSGMCKLSVIGDCHLYVIRAAAHQQLAALEALGRTAESATELQRALSLKPDSIAAATTTTADAANSHTDTSDSPSATLPPQVYYYSKVQLTMFIVMVLLQACSAIATAPMQYSVNYLRPRKTALDAQEAWVNEAITVLEKAQDSYSGSNSSNSGSGTSHLAAHNLGLAWSLVNDTERAIEGKRKESAIHHVQHTEPACCCPTTSKSAPLQVQLGVQLVKANRQQVQHRTLGFMTLCREAYSVLLSAAHSEATNADAHCSQADSALLYYTLGQLAEALPADASSDVDTDVDTDVNATIRSNGSRSSSSSSSALSAREWYAKAVEHSSSSDSSSSSSSSSDLQQTITVPALLAVARLSSCCISSTVCTAQPRNTVSRHMLLSLTVSYVMLASAMSHRFVLHREAGQYSEALAAATQALDTAGEAGAAVLEALREVGACHQQLNNHTAALQAYSEALNRSTSDVSATAQYQYCTVRTNHSDTAFTLCAAALIAISYSTD
eukprot:963-Heterococcus_DN1.PRE.2